MTAALVVFHNEGAHILDPLLRRGFKHCFCAIQDKNGFWIRFDPLAGCPEIDVAGGYEAELAEFWRGHGFTVVETTRGKEWPRGPFTNANCVGLVKVILNIRAPGVLTPWQLHRYLTRSKRGHR